MINDYQKKINDLEWRIIELETISNKELNKKRPFGLTKRTIYLVLPPLIHKQLTLLILISTVVRRRYLSTWLRVLNRYSLLRISCSVYSSKMYSQSFNMHLSSTGNFLFGILPATNSYRSFYFLYSEMQNTQFFVLQILN